VQATGVKSRQLGRRAIVTFAAIAVRPDSPFYTPQQLAGRKVGVPFYFGTHYLALHMLEGFVKREDIVVCSVPHGSRFRFDLLMNGEVDATTLTEPYVTLAEKKGCRLVCSAFYHGTQVGTDKIDAETLGAYNRAVTEAVRRIAANKRAYLQYFIDYHKARDPEIGTLTLDDMRESRLVVCEPSPIPLEEMQRTYDWVKSWGMLETAQTPLDLVNADVQARAHAAA
jgi:NitT/TauT family transport system substrate-binding protein